MKETRKRNFSIMIAIMVLSAFGYIYPINVYSLDTPEIMEFKITNTGLTKNGVLLNYNLRTNNDADIELWSVSADLSSSVTPSGWSGIKPDRMTLSVRSGTITLYARVKNRSGEISRPVSASTVICPMPVGSIEEYKSAGATGFRFNDKYHAINSPVTNLLIVAGGGGGGGGAGGASYSCGFDCYTCEDGSGGGGGGAGQLLSTLSYPLDPFALYQIVIGRGGSNGRGGGKHYSGHDASGGGPSWFSVDGSASYILYAYPGSGGEGGRNKDGDAWGDGGAGYPRGQNNHGDGDGGDGGDNGRGHGRANNGSAPDNSGGGGAGGNGSNCHSGGHDGGDGGSGYMSIDWKGILNQ